MHDRRNPFKAMCFALSLALGLLPLAGCATPGVGGHMVSRLDAVADRLDEQGAIVAVRVIDSETGETVYTHGNVDYPLKPASNMKLLTAALALETFGPDYAFTTTLAVDGDDLWVVGSGDPGTGDTAVAGGGEPTDMFDPWVAALKERGITRVAGDLIIDDLAIDRFYVHPTWWPEDDLQAWYGAPVGGLNFNDNCIDISAAPAGLGEPASIAVVPPGTELVIVNGLTAAEEGGDHAPALVKMPGADHYVLSGTLTREVSFSSRPVMDPGMFFAQAMRAYFAEHGIEIVGDTVRAEQHLDGWAGPGDARAVAVHRTPLPVVLARILKPSQNMFADCTSKIIGLAFHERNGIDLPGSWLAASRATHEWLNANGIDTRGLVFADGSGLSHNNRVTARLVSDLLLLMHAHEHAGVWRDSLTVGGVDGTLRRRFTEHPGRVVGKTGTLTGASALSGYVTTDGGEVLVFSILVNGHERSPDARALQDDLVRLLMEVE